MNCPTCNLPQDEHSEEMRANCAVFILDEPTYAGYIARHPISADADTERPISEAGAAPDRGEAPPTPSRSGASSFLADVCGSCLGPKTGDHARFCEDCVAEYAETNEVSPRVANISVASVLLGWCNDIKRELEEFANDGPVGPMVPYRADADTRREDLLRLETALSELIIPLHWLLTDVQGELLDKARV